MKLGGWTWWTAAALLLLVSSSSTTTLLVAAQQEGFGGGEAQVDPAGQVYQHNPEEELQRQQQQQRIREQEQEEERRRRVEWEQEEERRRRMEWEQEEERRRVREQQEAEEQRRRREQEEEIERRRRQLIEHAEARRREQAEAEEQRRRREQEEAAAAAAAACNAQCERWVQEALQPVTRERDEWRVAAEQLRRVMDDREREREDLAHRFMELERMHSVLNTDHTNWVNSYHALEANLLEHRKEIDKLREQLKAAQAHSEELENVLAATQEELDEATSISFSRLVQKELKNMWDSVIAMWEKLMEKFKK